MRKYEEVSPLMYSIANRIKLDVEFADDLVHDAWLAGRLHTCKDHELSKTITNDMLNARKAIYGHVGTKKFNAHLESVSLSDAAIHILESLLCDSSCHYEARDCADIFLDMLDFTEQMVVRNCIYRGQTLREIASDWGVVHSVVSDVYNKALTKMRESKLARELR